MEKNTDIPVKAEKFWDRTAKYYDKVEKRDEQTYLNIIERTGKYLKPEDIVLDFGCGTGLACNEIADKVKRIYAIDISTRMIEIAKSKADNCQIKNIDFTNTSIFDERYKRGSFDVILVFYILHLLEDTHKFMQRINELLVPGGLIISVTPCMGEKPLFNSLLSIGYKIGIAPEIVAFKFSELENLLVKAHFEIIESDFLRKNSPEYWLIAKKLKSVL